MNKKIIELVIIGVVTVGLSVLGTIPITKQIVIDYCNNIAQKV